MRATLRRLWYRGDHRYCPVCEKSARVFKPAGIRRRPDARCPFCGSLERHRLVWRYLCERPHLFGARAMRLLHVAPERCLEPRLRDRLARVGGEYVTADLARPQVMHRVDVQDMPFEDGAFDAAYCSHVLEHVPDDRRAMREFARILRPGGWALLLVPIDAKTTDEDPEVTDPQERLERFGQADHVRRYGPDYQDRLREAGFRVERFSPFDLVDRADAIRIGVTPPAAGDVFHCWKPM